MHRSGTSMVAGVVAALLGDDLDPRPMPSNVHGQYERVDLRPHVDGLLLLRRATWRHPPEEPASWPSGRMTDRIADRAIRRLGTGARVWKDPRLSITLPVWLRRLPAARIVMVLRDPTEVARSLHDRDATPLAEGLALWEAYVRAGVLAAEGREVFVVQHERALADPELMVSGLAEWLGIRSEEPRRLARDRVRPVATPSSGMTSSISDQRDPGTGQLAALWGAVRELDGPVVLSGRILPSPSPDLRSVIGSAPMSDLVATAMRTTKRGLSSPAAGRTVQR